MDAMRVLFWSELYWPYIGGAEVFGAKLIRGLRARGHDFVVVTSHDHLDLPDDDELDGVRIRRLPLRRALRSGEMRDFAASLAGAARLKREVEPDLIHVNGVGPSLLAHLRTSSASASPWLLTLQQEILASQTGSGETLLAQALGCADWVSGVSGAVVEQARRLVPAIAARSSVLYNAVDPPQVAPAPLPRATCLCLGRLVEAKGFATALDAFALLRSRIPDAALIVAGDGPLRADLEARAARLGIADATSFRGWVAPERVHETIDEATVVLLPSLREGLPVVAVQAALRARPIVAARVGGLPEIVVDGETGVLLDSRDPSRWADAVEGLLRDPTRAVTLGDAARRHALTAFAWDATVAGYDALYSKLAARAGTGC